MVQQKYQPTLGPHNCVNNDHLETILVPFERYQIGLSNGTKIVPNGSLFTKLWGPKVCTFVGPFRVWNDDDIQPD